METYRSFVNWRNADCGIEVARVNNDIIVIFLKNHTDISYEVDKQRYLAGELTSPLKPTRVVPKPPLSPPLELV